MKVAASAACVRIQWHDVRRREIIMVAGGPAGSFVLGAVAAFLAQATGYGLIHRLLELAAFTSLFSFAANMVPFKSGGFLSDGARIKVLLRRGGGAEGYWGRVGLASASS